MGFYNLHFYGELTKISFMYHLLPTLMKLVQSVVYFTEKEIQVPKSQLLKLDKENLER